MPTPSYTDLNDLITAINDRIKPNGNGAITGAVHQEALHITILSLVAMMGEVLPEVAANFPEWSSGTTYEGGSEVVVRHDGKLWLFVQATDSTGQEPGTNSLVWKEVSALQLAHFRGQDQTLDAGGPNEVSAAEIREHLDAAAAGVSGGVLYVSRLAGNDATGQRGDPMRPYETFDAAWAAAGDDDTVHIVDDYAECIGGALIVAGPRRITGGIVSGGGTLTFLPGATLMLETSWAANMLVDDGALILRNGGVGYVQVGSAGTFLATGSTVAALIAEGHIEMRGCHIMSVSTSMAAGAFLRINESTVQGNMVINASPTPDQVSLSNVVIRGTLTNTSGGTVAIRADQVSASASIEAEDITVTGYGNTFGPGGGIPGGLGTMAEQNADDVAITGGSISDAAVVVEWPIELKEAANKQYVDTAIASIAPQLRNVRVATTANINLASMSSSHDGVTLTNGQPFLARAQSAAAQNGIYLFNGAGLAATRHPDYDTFDEISGRMIIVNEGSTMADSIWLCTANPGGTLGTTSLGWIRVPVGVPLPVALGGTNATSTAAARTQLGTNDAGNLTTGTVAAARLPNAGPGIPGIASFPTVLDKPGTGVPALFQLFQSFGYRYYCSMYQVGPDMPEVAEANYLDTVVTWSRVAAGHYRMTTADDRFSEFTMVVISTSSNTHVRAAVGAANQIDVFTFNSSWAQVDGAMGFASMIVHSFTYTP